MSGSISDQPPTATNVQIAGTVLVGQNLVGSYSYSDAENDPEDTSGTGTSFRFVRSTDNNVSTSADNIDVASGPTVGVNQSYTLTSADFGKFLFYCVTPKAGSGTPTGAEVCSNTLGPVSTRQAIPVPTLSEWGTILLSGLFILLGAGILRRRQTRNV